METANINISGRDHSIILLAFQTVIEQLSYDQPEDFDITISHFLTIVESLINREPLPDDDILTIYAVITIAKAILQGDIEPASLSQKRKLVQSSKKLRSVCRKFENALSQGKSLPDSLARIHKLIGYENL